MRLLYPINGSIEGKLMFNSLYVKEKLSEKKKLEKTTSLLQTSWNKKIGAGGNGIYIVVIDGRHRTYNSTQSTTHIFNPLEIFG